jgi:dephospho-CoA kinase
MIVLALTGGIATGKSTTAALLRQMGIRVHDADKTVHRLIGPGGAAVDGIAKIWPHCMKDGSVDRAKLGRQVFVDQPQDLKKLNALLHPLVRLDEQVFLKRARRQGQKIVVLDIPLFFETDGAGRADFVLCTIAPPFLQKARALKRPGMTAEKLNAIRHRQWPERDKAAAASHVVPTGLGKAAAFRTLQKILPRLKNGPSPVTVARARTLRTYLHARNRP